MPENDCEIVATCAKCGYQFARPFPSFEVADDSGCPQCGHDPAGIEPGGSDQIDQYRLLRPGLRLERCPSDYVVGVLEKAFMQGLEGIDLRVTFSNRFEDKTKIEILAVN